MESGYMFVHELYLEGNTAVMETRESGDEVKGDGKIRR